MTRPLVIVGCGGFGRELLSIVRAAALGSGSRWEVRGFVDDDPSEVNLDRVQRLDSRVLGGLDVLARTGATDVLIGVGDNLARQQIAATLDEALVAFPILVHPDATIGAGVDLGRGVIVAPGARLSTNVVCGRHVHIDQNAAVAHDVRIGDFARVSPSASLTGGVHVGAGTLIGAGATLLPGVRIGDNAVVGAGATVVDSVPSGVTVKGVPAR